jgi:hypothetical protein
VIVCVRRPISPRRTRPPERSCSNTVRTMLAELEQREVGFLVRPHELGGDRLALRTQDRLPGTLVLRARPGRVAGTGAARGTGTESPGPGVREVNRGKRGGGCHGPIEP